jgi:quinol monooxygenase YgiN
MSVLVIQRFPGDTNRFRSWLREAADDLRRLRDQAQAAGAIHHRFGVEEGSAVVAVDEWPSAEAYQRFVQEANIQQVAQQAGASGPPDVQVYEAVSSPDEF